MTDQRMSPSSLYRRTTNQLGWALMIFLAFFYTITFGTEMIFAAIGTTHPAVRAVYAVFSSAAYVAPFLLAAYFFNRGRKNPASPVQYQKVRQDLHIPAAFPLLVLAGLGINFAAAYLNSFFCSAIGYTSSPAPDVSNYDAVGTVIFHMTTAIAPAFAEEYLFRGVVFAHLRPFGKWQAVLVSAMTFALMHQNVAQLFYTFVCGIVLALMYEWTGSIWCSIIFHLLNNELAVLSEVLLYGTYTETTSLILTVWDIAIMIIGAGCVVILAVYGSRRRKERLKREAMPAYASIFGSTADTTEQWDSSIAGKDVKYGLRAPGMMTFCIVAFVTILLDYLVVLGGGI